MSLLLESLKKAALEKQKKEKNSSSQEKITEKPVIVSDIHEQQKASIEDADLKVEDLVVFDSEEFEFIGEPDQAAETLERFDPVQNDEQQKTVQTDHTLDDSRLENLRQKQKRIEVKAPEKNESDSNPEENPVVHNQKAVAETQNNPIKDSRIPSFTPESGKAALTALLEKNKRIEKSVKTRSIYMIALLLLTGLVTLGSYYYFLMDSSSTITPTNQMQLYTHENNQPTVNDNINTENTASESVQEVAPIDGQESASAIAVEPNSNADSELALTQSQPVSQESKFAADHEPDKAPDESRSKKSMEKSITKSGEPISSGKPVAVTSQPIERYIQSQPAVDDAIAQHVNLAYQAYQQGQWTEAQMLYQKVLLLDTYNRDALLGAAAVAVRQGKPQEALGFYQQQLERDPQDEYAISGIMALGLDANKGALLSEIDRRLQDKPANVHLLFLKATILAAQQQWSAAQEIFFEAWNHDKNNADIVYNLAICLDRLHQPREAVRFYQMALSLKTASSNFSAANVEKRLARLTEFTP